MRLCATGYWKDLTYWRPDRILSEILIGSFPGFYQRFLIAEIDLFQLEIVVQGTFTQLEFDLQMQAFYNNFFS